MTHSAQQKLLLNLIVGMCQPIHPKFHVLSRVNHGSHKQVLLLSKNMPISGYVGGVNRVVLITADIEDACVVTNKPNPLVKKFCNSMISGLHFKQQQTA